MGKKLYVGNIPFSTTEDALNSHFSQVGTVESANVIMDRMSGRSKGFAFVEMSTEDEAKAAVEQFNGKDFGGRNIIVNEAREQEPRGGGRGGFGGGGRGGDRGGRGGFGGGRGGGDRY